MSTLADDLMLLVIHARRGRVPPGGRLPYALCVAELVELRRAGRIAVETGGGPPRMVVLDSTPLGDDRLDRLLNLIGEERNAPSPSAWVRTRVLTSRMENVYLKRLQESGAVTVEDLSGRQPGPRRIRCMDRVRRDDVRARLDAVVALAEPGDARDAALAGLVHAIGLGERLYRGPFNRRRRKRLAEVARADWGAIAVARSLPTRRRGDSEIEINSSGDVSAAIRLDITSHLP